MAASASAAVERIAYEVPGGIAAADANGANQRFLTGACCGGSADRPALSPNGQQVAFDEIGDGIGITDMNGYWRVLVDDTSGTTGAHDSAPRWSPDGSKLVFERSVSDGKQYDIYTINVDGSGLTRLVSWTGSQTAPTFSPDGSKITFASDATPTGTNLKSRTIYTVTAATGGSPVKLAAGDLPSYSPDGTKIGMTSGGNIYTMTNAGGSRTALTSDGLSTSPSWSPDGQTIAYTYRVPGGTYNVYEMTATGGSKTAVITGGYRAGPSYRQPGGSTVYDYMADELRPTLLFDNSESWRPLSLASFFGENQHLVCANGSCVPVSTAQGLLTYPDPSAYLDIAGTGSETNYVNPTLVSDCPASAVAGLRDCDTGGRSAIYYHVTDPSPGGYHYVDYWFFYRFNYFGSVWPASSLGNHEGDWEGVSLAPSQGATNTFDYASFSQHGTWYSYLRTTLSCDGGPAGSCGSQTSKAGRRVNVFVTNGDHANYGAPCSETIYGDCAQQDGITPERGHDGAKAWGRNNDDPTGTILKFPALNTSSWVDWAGQWGSPSEQPNPGPASPGKQQPHYSSPWISTCYESGCNHERRAVRAPLLRPSTAATAAMSSQSCSNWFGAGVAVLACQPVRLAAAVRHASIGRRAHLSLTMSRRHKSVGRAPGLAQVMGAALRPGDRIAVRHAEAGTALYVRLIVGRRSYEALFVYRGRPGATWRIEVRAPRRNTTVIARDAAGRRVLPIEQFGARVARRHRR